MNENHFMNVSENNQFRFEKSQLQILKIMVFVLDD